MSKKPDALKSLYGKGHVDATRTRECVAMPGKREQTILTPQCIVDGLQKFWILDVEMDPCSAPGQLVQARQKPKDGLSVDWPKGTYCNPPYGSLARWLKHGIAFWEVVWLVPNRTHRTWYREWYGALSARIALDPLAFEGYDQPYPAALLLGYKGESTHEFYEAFGHLGGRI